MRLTYLLVFFLFHFCCQGQYIQAATLSAGGGVGGSHGKYYLAHVVSQSSIVAGTVRSGNVIVRQGFKQPVTSKRLTEYQSSMLVMAEPVAPILVDVFPNPFTDHILLRFSETTHTPTRLTLYDNTSNLIWERVFPKNIMEIPLEGFAKMRAGKYLLQIFQDGNPLIKTIIKEVQP